jgi:serine protease Do
MMKKSSPWRQLLLCSATSLFLFPFTVSAAEEPSESKVERHIEIIRSDGDPKVEKKMHVFVNHITSAHEMDTGPVTFLGVETVKVSSTLTEQLGLDRGMGLVVQRVIDGTAAADVLKKHDILTKLDDQLIVSPDQLGVLVRSKNPGTEVKLTFVRGGKVQTAKVTLQERKGSQSHVIHMAGDHESHSMALPSGGSQMEVLRRKLDGSGIHIDRAEVDRLLSKFGSKTSSGIDWDANGDTPIVHMMTINSGNVVFSDDEGAIELKADGDEKTLVVKSTNGDVLFEGPVNNDEERGALNEAIKLRLEKVEGIRKLEFRTDDSFESEEIRVISPQGGSVRVIRRGEQRPLVLGGSSA